MAFFSVLIIQNTDMQSRITPDNHWSGKIKSSHSDESVIYTSLHNQYMFIQNITITMIGIFHEELSVLTHENCFCLLLSVCYIPGSVKKISEHCLITF